MTFDVFDKWRVIYSQLLDTDLISEMSPGNNASDAQDSFETRILMTEMSHKKRPMAGVNPVWTLLALA